MSRRRRTAALAAAATAAMSEGPTGLGGRISAVPALIRDTLTGRYDGLSRGRLAMMLVAVLYLVSPIDLVPEGLLTIPGLVDDAAIGAWLVAAVLGAAGAYRAHQGPVTPAGSDQAPGRHDVVRGEVVTG